MKKKNTSIITIILVLIALVCGIYIGSTYMNNNKDTKTTEKDNTKKKEKEEEKNEEREFKFDEKTKEKVETIMRYIPADYTKIKANDLTNQEKLNIAFYLYEYDNDWQEEKISKKDIKATLEKVLGKKTEYEDETIYSLHYIDEVIAKYNETKELYTYDSGSAHGYKDTEDYNYILSTDIKDNILTLDVKRVYYLATDTGPITEIYKDFELYNKIKVDKKYCEEEYEDDICAIDVDKYIEDNKDSIKTIKYIFDLSDDYPTFVEMK